MTDGAHPAPRGHVLHAWLASAQETVARSRSRSSGVDAAFNVQTRDRAVGGNLLACAVAYRLFLWLLPLALLIAAGLGFAEAAGQDQPAEVASDFGIGRSLLTVVSDAAGQAERSRVPLLALALVGLYSAGGGGAKTLVAVHRFAWSMPPARTRGGPKPVLAFTAAAGSIVALAAGAQVLRRASPGLGLTATLVLAFAWTAVWLGVSWVLPHGDAPWLRLLPGAIFLGFGSQLLHLVTVFYLAGKIETASELYGGLGFAATLLLGLYLFSRLVVGAAVLNATLWERGLVRRGDVAQG